MTRLAKRLLITDAQRLCISDLRRAGVFAHPGEVHFIPLLPVGSPSDVPLLACFLRAEGESLAVAHHVGDPGRNRKINHSWIEFDRTPGHFGGTRYWFVCPGPRCPHAVSKTLTNADQRPSPQGRTTALYLPPGATQFRCRECHQLTYSTKQLHYSSGGAKSRPSSRCRPTAPPLSAIPSLNAARAEILRLLQDALKTLVPSGELNGQRGLEGEYADSAVVR